MVLGAGASAAAASPPGVSSKLIQFNFDVDDDAPMFLRGPCVVWRACGHDADDVWYMFWRLTPNRVRPFAEIIRHQLRASPAGVRENISS